MLILSHSEDLLSAPCFESRLDIVVSASDGAHITGEDTDGVYTIRKSILKSIADAIRSKNGSPAEYTPAEMATAIEEL